MLRLFTLGLLVQLYSWENYQFTPTQRSVLGQVYAGRATESLQFSSCEGRCQDSSSLVVIEKYIPSLIGELQHSFVGHRFWRGRSKRSASGKSRSGDGKGDHG
ncbi:hypothetical protein B0F90DRAFT_1748751 [Multifurca ochricompacta]|uniref:Uncharacterized protein n=1 Tax=Multifurca ochricompacta TaxID=376703 RepID=A0AAD4QL50_9AGAM|nr:hypothetical protein B0F90DRAFT_1748751 [Multifurca ochricompacta]